MTVFFVKLILRGYLNKNVFVLIVIQLLFIEDINIEVFNTFEHLRKEMKMNTGNTKIKRRIGMPSHKSHYCQQFSI